MKKYVAIFSVALAHYVTGVALFIVAFSRALARFDNMPIKSNILLDHGFEAFYFPLGSLTLSLHLPFGDYMLILNSAFWAIALVEITRRTTEFVRNKR